ncbi:hypothetical protein Asera_32750 [Actinocatenispora sera]|uniref:Endonuclease/exonuclease/phosphatase domain-containing protein n=1 Tax=Actinocatenispora sera TaxID=390989 RepID=A0A810L1S7_9ACTN|nr:hypothetical protein Asera_32750 [Actinocatenispora sera]
MEVLVTGRVRVLSYNVHGLSDDREALYRVVRAARPDIVFVQEAPRRFRWRTRCAELARHCGMFFGAGGGPAIGNLIMVGQRVRVVRDWSLRFPLAPGRHLRGVAFADCELADGGRFTAVGTHLGTDPAERTDQAERLAAVICAQQPPVLFAADLNEAPGGQVWSHLTSTTLTDPSPGKGDPTYPAAAPRLRLDAVLAPAQTTVHDHRVLDTDDARLASDHLPVLADLTLP